MKVNLDKIKQHNASTYKTKFDLAQKKKVLKYVYGELVTITV